MGHGHAEAFFGSIKDFAWQNRFQRLLQNVFRGAFTKFVGAGDSPDEIDQFNVQKRRTCFKTVHHAGAIRLHKDAILQIELAEELHGLIDQVGLWTFIPLLDRLGVKFLEIDRLVEKILQAGVVERRHPDWQPHSAVKA